MSRNTTLALALAPILLLTACSDPNKAPAEKALAAAETAVGQLTDDVRTYAPEAASAAREALGNAKSLAAKQDYKGALAAAGEIPAKVQAAVAEAQARKADVAKKDAEAQKVAALQKAWNEATSAMPALLGDLKARLATLSKAKKLPKGITKKSLATAKTTLKTIEDGFAKVKEQAKTDLEAATAKAGELAAKAHDLATQLKGK